MTETQTPAEILAEYTRTVPRYARKAQSTVEHRLVLGTKTTLCGLDATLYARYSSADNLVDSRVWRMCRNCRNPR